MLIGPVFPATTNTPVLDVKVFEHEFAQGSGGVRGVDEAVLLIEQNPDTAGGNPIS